MDSLSVYRELADCYDRLGQASMRDRFLILAADSALEAGQPSEAERFRQRLLQGSRHHMLRPYASFAEAALAPDVQTYLRDLRLNYPLEVARQLLDSLQGGNTAPKAALHETAPLNQLFPPATLPPPDDPEPIPPTMPLIDPNGPARQGNIGGQQWQQQRARSARPEAGPAPPRQGQGESYPIREEPIPTAPLPPNRPLGQPLPGRTPMSRPAAPRPVVPPVARPVAPPQRLAETMPLQRPSPPARPAFAPLPAPQHETPAHGGGWLNMLLVGVVFTAGLALLLFALARPLLPAAWLP